jgi:hypothetical protein
MTYGSGGLQQDDRKSLEKGLMVLVVLVLSRSKVKDLMGSFAAQTKRARTTASVKPLNAVTTEDE